MLYILFLLAQLPSDPSLAIPSYRDVDVIEYTRSIDIETLDPALPAQHLDEWLQTGPVHAENLRWRVSSDCDLKPPSEPDGPLCVKFGFAVGDVSVGGMITVGTRAKGVAGIPRLEYLSALKLPVRAENRRTTRWLSDLPAVIGELSAAPPTLPSERILAHAKAIDVGRLDPDLQPERLDTWLQREIARSGRIEWRIAATCEEPVPPSGDLLCVRFSTTREEVSAWGVLVVGTLSEGIGGRPRLQSASVMRATSGDGQPLKTTKLSELPKLIAQSLQHGW